MAVGTPKERQRDRTGKAVPSPPCASGGAGAVRRRRLGRRRLGRRRLGQLAALPVHVLPLGRAAGPRQGARGESVRHSGSCCWLLVGVGADANTTTTTTTTTTSKSKSKSKSTTTTTTTTTTTNMTTGTRARRKRRRRRRQRSTKSASRSASRQSESAVRTSLPRTVSPGDLALSARLRTVEPALRLVHCASSQRLNCVCATVRQINRGQLHTALRACVRGHRPDVQ